MVFGELAVAGKVCVVSDPAVTVSLYFLQAPGVDTGFPVVLLCRELVTVLWICVRVLWVDENTEVVFLEVKELCPVVEVVGDVVEVLRQRCITVPLGDLP